MNKSTLIIDCNNMAYRALHTTGTLDNGIVYGFLKQILTFAREFKSNRFIFCWDSKMSYRKDVEPTYKLRPPKSEEQIEELTEAFAQFKQLRREILPSLGFKNIFCQPKYEADDLIAHVVQRFPADYIIISGDEDLYQLLTTHKKYEVKIYQPIKKRIVTYDDFVQEYKITPSEWAKVKALGGCSSDHVIGIEGVGEKTAIKYLRNELNPGKVYDRIEDQKKEMTRRNYPLVCLPFAGDRPINITEIKYEELMVGDFMDTFQRLEFISLLSEEAFSDWEEAFQLLAF